MLVGAGRFQAKKLETIEGYYNHFNELIYKCSWYGVIRTSTDFKINFILGLRTEWRNICLMIKTHEKFDSYYLSNLYNILKAHKSEAKEIVDDKD